MDEVRPTLVGARLAGRTALVTGAAGGIGTAIASRLAADGAAVAICDVDRERCEETAARLREGGAAAIAAPADVTDPAAAAGAIEAVAELGMLDILVNNAGVVRDGPVHKLADEDWRAVLEVGLYGAFCMTRAAAPVLRQDAGHHRKVVNVSSNVALHGAPGTVNYAAAKAGLIGLTRSLAREWARRRVNVNAVAPGLIMGTGMTQEKPADLIARVAEQIPIGRPGTVEDVAAAVAYLAAPDSDFVTGQVLELSGGLEVPG
jgi:3-oxoacyl-[acyl-carrier protein] reductase